MAKMKIAIVHPSLAVKGGAENLMIWMARGLAGRGHHVTLFTTEYEPEFWDEDKDKLIEITLFRPGFLSRLVNSKRVSIRDYGNQLSNFLEDYEVIFCSLFPSHLWVTRAKRRTSKINGKIIWYLQEPSRKSYWKLTDRHLIEHAKYCSNPEYNQHLRRNVEIRTKRDNEPKTLRQMSWDREAVKHIDLILANSRFSAENIMHAFGAPVEVCYPGIPTYPDSLSGNKGGCLVSIAALRPKKNVHNVIEALYILSAERDRKDIQLKIAGQGSCRSELETLVRNRNLTSHVEFLGYVTDQELRNIYREARLSVYVPIDEPFGLIAFESMYHGVPPIVSDHGGVAETVIHGETGLLVNPFDPVKIADSIESLWDDDERIHKMRLAGRRRVEKKFTQEHLISRLEEFLERVRFKSSEERTRRSS